PDSDGGLGECAGRAPGHPGRARRARTRGGQVLGHRAHRRRRAVAGLGAMTDLVSVRDLAVAAVIGVPDRGRGNRPTLVPRVDVTGGGGKAGGSDDLADALDSSAVAETIAAVLREGKFRLIETAAERVAGRLLADFPLTWLRLELRKPITNGPTPYTAAITIE